ncbi:carboxypeptidase-like regulatory domain-containing protein [Mucilaginibacter sp. AK015]|uniref:carboxypeptidase-like regulatory domain-containing protein n=1 Tax=Mucilaginibacter sp. AK015 TaxID=2723072 RepID=UPI001618BBDC|nr:carboxypeptidase-like regulatory domain-containing protein [Mucilaginibacter sp. AK015]MBB5397949.1 hypothetical protein [Mucilaginibacter sp. AK015]
MEFIYGNVVWHASYYKTNIMQPLKSITIPQPCHQNWNEMTPVEQGRHCAHCSKTVTDFTAMTNSQIVSYLAERDNVCGRFDNYQLPGLNNMVTVQHRLKFCWKRLAVAAAITSFFATTKAEAQRTVGKVAITQSVNNPKAILIGDTITYTTIKGKIVADDDNKPVPGAIIRVKGTTIGTQANENGEFSLNVPSNAQTLSISL